MFFLSSGVGQARPAAAPAASTFECVLPYISGGGVVSLVNASAEAQVVETTVMNAHRYNIVVPKNSSYSFQSPVYQDFFVPVVHGGPISFKSDQPIVAYTVLNEYSVTVQCSDPTKRTKVFVGNPKTGMAIVNTTRSPIKVQVFQDSEQTPILTLTMAAEERTLGFLGDAIPVSGTHTYVVVAESDGIGLAAISYDRSPATAIPIAEK
jgi:hypothetical protein